MVFLLMKKFFCRHIGMRARIQPHEGMHEPDMMRLRNTVSTAVYALRRGMACHFPRRTAIALRIMAQTNPPAVSEIHGSSSAKVEISACIIGCACKLRLYIRLIHICLQISTAQIAESFRVYQACDFICI